MNKTVFLDLEETLVESWTDHRLVKKHKVTEFLNLHGREVELFSFAVYNQDDVKQFNKELKDFLEGVHNITFTKVHALDDMVKVVQDFRSMKFESPVEIISLFGKTRVFEDFCLAQNLKNHKFVLLDDTVENRTVKYTDKNVELEFVRC